jgi:ubiquitin-conjugating enzyme E2 O
VQPFEIIGLDRLLDSSLESMNEERTAGDLVDTSEEEEMHHDSTNVSFPLYPYCTDYQFHLCKMY